jgi:heat shock protein HslJ
MSRALLSIIAVVFLLASCGGAGSGAPMIDGEAADPSGSWTLAGAEPTIDIPGDARVTLEVVPDGDDWEVGGVAACNSYSGSVSTEGSTWRTEGYGATEMGCEEPLMSIEQTYLAALTTVDAWTRTSADELVLTGPGIELRFEVLPPVPTAELTATTWVLDGLVSGTGPDAAVSSIVADADQASLRLAPDGTMEASTGCRTFAGEWIESGDEVLLTTFGMRDDSPNVAADGTTTCDESVVAQEDHVLSVLGDGFRAVIDGQRLTLTSRDGLGLSYRAADG